MDRSTWEQQAKRQLRGVAADLKWSAVELAQIADRLSQTGNELDAQALHRMASILRKDEVSLEEVAGQLGAAGTDQREPIAPAY